MPMLPSDVAMLMRQIYRPRCERILRKSPVI